MRRENKTLLIIDDNPERRRDLAVILGCLGEAYVACSTEYWEQTLARIPTNELSGLVLGTISVTSRMLSLLAVVDKHLPVLLVDQAQLDTWPELLRLRVSVCIDWPASYTILLDALHKLHTYRHLHASSRQKSGWRDATAFRSLVGASPAIQFVRHMMQQVADTEASVLILGESGTGKEVVARNLHEYSRRRIAPFVPVNCGAIPAELLESELFGHEKGAFTGAITSRAGRFELAHGGTLFLDEIGDMPLPMQVKLLRVLQERTFERVGSNRTQNVDVRIIAATHKNLEQMITQGSFREDLYYRLNVFPIDMPPLRERTEDIPLLLHELVARMEREKRGFVRFTASAIAALSQYRWPGNVRELANLVERMAIMYPNGIVGLPELPQKFRQNVADGPDDIMAVLDELEEERTLLLEDTLIAEASVPSWEDAGRLPEEGLDLKEYLSNLEQNLIQQALDESSGVVARAAERLHVRRTTLVEKMRKYGMSRRDELTYLSD